jgi:hypothetical protein
MTSIDPSNSLPACLASYPSPVLNSVNCSSRCLPSRLPTHTHTQITAASDPTLCVFHRCITMYSWFRIMCVPSCTTNEGYPGGLIPLLHPNRSKVQSTLPPTIQSFYYLYSNARWSSTLQALLLFCQSCLFHIFYNTVWYKMFCIWSLRNMSSI